MANGICPYSSWAEGLWRTTEGGRPYGEAKRLAAFRLPPPYEDAGIWEKTLASRPTGQFGARIGGASGKPRPTPSPVFGWKDWRVGMKTRPYGNINSWAEGLAGAEGVSPYEKKYCRRAIDNCPYRRNGDRRGKAL